MGISRDEWLHALQEANIDLCIHDPDSITTGEFGEMLNIDRSAAARRLKLLVKAGRATRTTKRVQGSDGRTVTLPAYKLVEEKPAKKRR